MKADINELVNHLITSYKDTLNRHGKKQAIGSTLIYLTKHDTSFISGAENRMKLSKYTDSDINLILIEYVINKIGYTKDTIELGKHLDIDKCEDYDYAKNVIINFLLKYDYINKKIAFGDILNIIKTIQLHECIKNQLINNFVLDVFANDIKFDYVNVPFKISYKDDTDELKVVELNGVKIIGYIKNEYNLNK